ncbi:MAG: hypothetical protein HYX56_02500 [Chloroflexi bacterium]|nr:hypothetical protein [Chloroflexota bacterium]
MKAIAVVHLRGEVSETRHAKVLEALSRMLPRVGVEGRGTFACDLRGTQRLLGAPEKVGARIVSSLAAARIASAVGIAQRPFAARVLAERTATGEVASLPLAQERAFLAALPLSALPLDHAHRDELALLGIRSVGAFAELGRGAVLDRFGRAVAAAHALACGEDAGEVRGTAPRRRIAAKRTWDGAVTEREQLAFALKTVIDEVGATLVREGLAALRLEVRLEREDAPVLRFERLVLPPAASPETLLRSVRWALEEHTEAPAALDRIGRVTGVRVEALEVEPARGRQIGLFAADGATEEEAIAVARYLRSRLGAGAVLRATVTDPEARLAEREAEWEEAVS